jgi:hypothetical protein
VTETGLLIAEGVFLLLLYLFIWWVVRSSSREVGKAETPLVAPAPPREDTSRERALDVPVPPVAVAVGEPAPPAELAPPVPEPPLSEASVRAEERRGDSGPIFDMTSGLHPRLVVERSPDLAPGAEHELEGGLTIGRSESCRLSVPDAFVSHMHARVFRRGQFHFVEDLGSTNGTFLNDRRITQETQLKVHDELRMGETVLRYEE